MGDPDAKTPPLATEGATEGTTSEERQWAMLAHLSFLLTFVVGFSLIAPLIIWIVKKDSSAFIEDQAKEALNFQLSLLIAFVVLSVTCVGPLVILVAGTVYAIIGGMAANGGEVYRYPYTFRMIN